MSRTLVVREAVLQHDLAGVVAFGEHAQHRLAIHHDHGADAAFGHGADGIVDGESGATVTTAGLDFS